MKHPIEWHEAQLELWRSRLRECKVDLRELRRSTESHKAIVRRITEKLAAARHLGLTEFDAETFQP